MKVTDEIAAILKSYVYVYTDPRNGIPFYIGKGKGNQIFEHLNDTSESRKTTTIAAIRSAGLEPQIDILRYSLTDSEATLVEASAIDLLGLARLTNQVAGHHDDSYGRIGSRDIVAMLQATPVEVRHRALLITINRLYRSDMTPLELYEATRGIWVLGPRREHAEYAMAVYQGVVREVYHINMWHPSGTLHCETRDSSNFAARERWEFEGEVAKDIRDLYVGKSVGPGGQNPIRYKNV